MLTAENIRRIIYGEIKTGSWTSLDDIYHLIDRSGQLEEDDHVPSAPGNPEARWGLTWHDVDLSDGRVHVRQTLHWATHKRTWSLAEPKTERSRRSLDLATITLVALEEHRLRQNMETNLASSLWEQHGFVFTTPIGRPLESANVGHTFHRILERAGLRRQRFHDLRHGAASLLLSQGASLREIMEILGHSQIGLTANLYTHLTPAMKKEGAARMDAVLAGLRPDRTEES